jgi:hypothetical protein
MAEPPEDDLLRAIRRAEENQRSAGSIPFTPPAYDELNRRIADYIGELVDESIRVARRRHSPDIVSTSDVERASDHLGLRSRNRRAQIIGSLGSLLFGAALGNALQFAGAPQIAAESALLTFGLGAVGAAMTMLGFVWD